jgi:hypothetical protein
VSRPSVSRAHYSTLSTPHTRQWQTSAQLLVAKGAELFLKFVGDAFLFLFKLVFQIDFLFSQLKKPRTTGD